MDLVMVYPETVHTDEYLPPTRSASMTRVNSMIQIDLETTTVKHIFRVVTKPVNPGDLFFIKAEGKVMNETGRRVTGDRAVIGTQYNVGVGWHIGAYHYEDPRPIETKRVLMQKSRGENVIPAVHHMSFSIETYGVVPSDFPAGDRLVFQLCADAHSTAYKINEPKGLYPESLVVEDSGVIIATHYRAPLTPVDSAAAFTWANQEPMGVFGA